MTDQPKTKTEPTRPSDPSPTSSKSPAATPAPSSTMVDPAHHEFGDKTDEDAGEGHKGPRTDGTKTASENRSIEAL
jgi:hypothetical protein